MSSNRVKRDVRIDVAAGSLGVVLEADYNGMCAVIKSFQLTPSGRECRFNLFLVPNTAAIY